jgi:hypothetical protein
MEERIELRTAYAWDCPSCGHHPNFVEAMTAELTDDEKTELLKRFGDPNEGEEWKAGESFIEDCGLVTYPDSVTCSKCGAAFPTAEHPGAMPPGFHPHKDL